jgi:hypothetical protein
MDKPILKSQAPDSSRMNLDGHCQDSTNRLKCLIKEHFDNCNYGCILISEVCPTTDTIATLVMVECKNTERMKIFTIKKSLKEVSEADISCLAATNYEIGLTTIEIA